jgi:hypothetical protein
VSATTLDKIGELFARALVPISEAARHPETLASILAALGWDQPLGVDLAMLMTLDASTVIDKLQAVLQSTPEELDDSDTMVARYGELGVAVAALIVDIGELADGLPAKLAAAGDYATKSSIKDELPRRLLDYLLVSALDQLAPPLLYALRTLGIVHYDPYPADASIYQVAHRRIVVAYDRFGTLFSKPGQLFVDEYGWGTASFDAEPLLENLGFLIQSLGPRVILRDMPQAAEEALGGRAMPEAAADPSPQLLVPMTVRAGPATADVVLSLHRLRATTVGATDAGIELAALVTGAAEVSIPFGDTLALAIDATVDLGGGAGIAVRPNGAQLHLGFLDGGTPGAGASGTLGVGLHRKRADGKPSTILSAPGGTRVEANDVSVTAGINLAVGKDPDPFVQAAIVGGHIMVTLGGADGFLSKVLPDAGIESRFDLKISWSRLLGLRIEGSGVLEIDIPVHETFGPFNLDSIKLRLGLAGQGLSLIAAATGGVTIGPAHATIENVGIRADLAFRQGNLGPANLGLGFKAPDGLGAVVKAGPVTGGGFVSHDEMTGRYAGILELKISAISIKAIGLLDTKLPDGSEGYSFLIIITVEFSPIQLGMGFTLNGVGGLAGINRTMVTEAIQAGIRNHSVDHILFPDDPVAHAAEIISDLSAIFPPKQGRYVFGPMAIIGYGSPSLIEAEIGILIVLPAPVELVLLGQLSAALPEKDDAVVELHLDVLGVIDFAKGTIAIDAVLHDSRIVAFSLFGDMALRMSVGDQPNFALAVGGFHPQFPTPPGFPQLRRMTLALATKDGNPQLAFETYFAITSNSVQIGARGEIKASAMGFDLAGWMGFDVLVHFSPFTFLAEISAGVVVRKGSMQIASVAIVGRLSGPAPWQIDGKATFDCIVHVEVPVRATIGDAAGDTQILPVDPAPLLVAALSDPRNWSATLPAAGERVVSLRAPDASRAAPLVDPLGGVGVRQRVVPLNRKITRFGEAAPAGPERYQLGAVEIGGAAAGTPTTLQEHFAPAQFETLTDQEKLSRPAFERMDAGFDVAADFIDVGPVVGADLHISTIIADRPDVPAATEAMPETRVSAGLASSASARPPLVSGGTAAYAPPPGAPPAAQLADERWVVVSRATLAPVALAAAASKGAALHALGDYVVAHPKSEALQVVPECEAA